MSFLNPFISLINKDNVLKTSMKRTGVKLKYIKYPTQSRSLEQCVTLAKISLHCILKMEIPL